MEGDMHLPVPATTGHDEPDAIRVAPDEPWRT